ncbi:hypothetical protein Dimus_013539 [Dionaea muscipula]
MGYDQLKSQVNYSASTTQKTKSTQINPHPNNYNIHLLSHTASSKHRRAAVNRGIHTPTSINHVPKPEQSQNIKLQRPVGEQNQSRNHGAHSVVIRGRSKVSASSTPPAGKRGGLPNGGCDLEAKARKDVHGMVAEQQPALGSPNRSHNLKQESEKGHHLQNKKYHALCISIQVRDHISTSTPPTGGVRRRATCQLEAEEPGLQQRRRRASKRGGINMEKHLKDRCQQTWWQANHELETTTNIVLSKPSAPTTSKPSSSSPSHQNRNPLRESRNPSKAKLKPNRRRISADSSRSQKSLGQL